MAAMTRYEALLAKMAEKKVKERDDEKRKAGAEAKALENMQRLVQAQIKGFLGESGFPERLVHYVTDNDHKVKLGELPPLSRYKGQLAEWRVVFEANVSGDPEKHGIWAKAEWLLKPVGGGKVEFHYGACRVILPGAPPDELYRLTWEAFEKHALKKADLVPL
jgi:hypothetical protein